MISALGARLRSLPIVANLDNLNLRGFAIQSITPLDPSGWVRVSLARAQTAAPVMTTAAPVAPVQTVVQARPDLPRGHATGAALSRGHAASPQLHRCLAAGSGTGDNRAGARLPGERGEVTWRQALHAK